MPKHSRVTDITIDSYSNDSNSGLDSPVSANKGLNKAAEQFSEFYKRATPPDIGVLLQTARQKRTWLAITFSLVVLLAVTVTGIWFFTKSSGGKFGEEAVQISLSGPPSAPSGQVVELLVSYHNNQGVGLKSGELNLRYPTGFIFQSADPSPVNSDGTRFELTRVKAKGQGQIAIRGQLLGKVGESLEFTAILNYQPNNLKAEYVKTVKFNITLVASVLNLEVTGPQTVVTGRETSFTVTYRNSSLQPVTRVLIRATPPNGFELRSPSLESFPDQPSTWRLPDIPAGESGTQEFSGLFTTGVVPGEQEFRFAIGLIGEDNHSFALQEEKMLTTALISSKLLVTVAVNSSRAETVAELGQELNLEAAVTNEGDTTINQAELALVLPSTWFDWATFHDQVSGNVVVQDGVARWTATDLPALSKIDPRGTVMVRAKVRLQPQLPVGVSGNASFVLHAEAKAQERVGEQNEEINSKTSDLTVKISTHLSLTAEGRYFTDDLVKVGSGPLPPRVGQTTTYVINWQLSNTWNEVTDVVVTTTLPTGVTWTSQSTVSAGDKLTYNSGTGEVRWTLNKLPAGTGSFLSKPVASFAVALTPSEQDLDKILVLTKASSVNGLDSWTAAPVARQTKFITTDLDGDPMAEGKGVVGRE